MPQIVIVAIDGLQPAQVTPGLMPNLAAFAGEGVTFANHHSVYPTVTRTNVVSMMTGCLPGAHGLHGNTLVVRDFDADRAIPALRQELTRLEDKTGRVILAPHLADILEGHGQEYVAIASGTSGNAFLHHPNSNTTAGAVVHTEFSRPGHLHGELADTFGAWPEEARPNSARVSHAFRLLKEYVLSKREPTVSLVWSSDPDGTQHAAGVGSKVADESLAHVDRELGELADWLSRTGRDTSTDVVVVSDHGYSTVIHPVEVEALVRKAGFPSGGRPGGVIVAPNGGTMLFYVNRRNPATAGRLAVWLMAQPWCGSLLASDALGEIEGTLPSSVVGCEGERAPDLVMSFAWNSEPNDAGFSGHAFNSGGAPGLGMHGSMSRHELHNVLIARGPSFKEHVSVNAPSGNVDLTPTLLSILGVDSGTPMDGRVLSEALRGGPDPETVRRSSRSHQAERAVEGGHYRQSVTVSQVAEAMYVDEGNASFDAA